VIDLLAASDRPNYTQIARLAGVERRVVARIAHGQHISQRLPHRPIGPLSLPRSR